MIPRKSVPLEKLQSSRPAHPGNSQLIEPAPQKIDKLRWWLRSARISGCWLLILPTSPYQWTFTMGPCTAQNMLVLKPIWLCCLIPSLYCHFYIFISIHLFTDKLSSEVGRIPKRVQGVTMGHLSTIRCLERKCSWKLCQSHRSRSSSIASAMELP